ncbi:MAG TPA: hypothetical protein VE196_03950 [Pseudonocardiaceae bacterium]|nr:hypothetical protein [Pseudonocardiaceae bacterium]
MAEVETGEGDGARAGAAAVLVLDVDGVLAADPGAVAGGEATVRAGIHRAPV